MTSSIERLYQLPPWQGAAFSLDTAKKLAEALGSPQDAYRTVLVAGTNGKGSVVSFLSQIMMSAGNKVGTMTSPHLERVNERISISGEDIADAELELLAAEVMAKASNLDLKISFFEAITAIGFLHFRNQKVDFGIIEVGLGGMLDATNVISKPDISVITSIGLDHVDILGDTLEKIAAEKAGIFRNGGQKVVIGEMADGARSVIEEKARALGCSIFRSGWEFSVDKSGRFTSNHDLLKPHSLTIAPKLHGFHQVKNGAVAACCGKLLGVSDSAIEEGISKTTWPARLEVFNIRSRTIIIDSAHNLQGIQVLIEYLEEKKLDKLVTVFGTIRTKNWQEELRTLYPKISNLHIIEPDSSMAVPCVDISHFAESLELITSMHYNDYEGLISELLAEKYKDKVILITGSIYLNGKLRPILVRNLAA